MEGLGQSALDLLVGGGIYRTLTSALPGAMKTAATLGLGLVEAPRILSRLFMTPNGQQFLLRMMQERGPLLDGAFLGLGAAATRAATAPAAQPRRTP